MAVGRFLFAQLISRCLILPLFKCKRFIFGDFSVCFYLAGCLCTSEEPQGPHGNDRHNRAGRKGNTLNPQESSRTHQVHQGGGEAAQLQEDEERPPAGKRWGGGLGKTLL